jgi:hypothetical protein
MDNASYYKKEKLKIKVAKRGTPKKHTLKKIKGHFLILFLQN